MLWQLMENGLEELKLLQTVLVLLTTNTVVHDQVLSKVPYTQHTHCRHFIYSQYSQIVHAVSQTRLILPRELVSTSM